MILIKMGFDWMSDLLLGANQVIRGFALVAVLTMAVGIGANTAMFSVIENVILLARYPIVTWRASSYSGPECPKRTFKKVDFLSWYSGLEA
jgi:hypothetical protein